jgi:hypothetical protein
MCRVRIFSAFVVLGRLLLPDPCDSALGKCGGDAIL